jgi:hypothetical protein
MSMAQAMVFAIPGIMFDLPNLKDYYTKGVVKVPCFDYEKFAEEIVRLLTQKEHYEKIDSHSPPRPSLCMLRTKHSTQLRPKSALG